MKPSTVLEIELDAVTDIQKADVGVIDPPARRTVEGADSSVRPKGNNCLDDADRLVDSGCSAAVQTVSRKWFNLVILGGGSRQQTVAVRDGGRVRLSFEAKCLQFRESTRNVASYENGNAVGVYGGIRIPNVE